MVELLIAIALVGIMAMGLITLLNPLAQIQKANDAKRKSDLNQIQKAVEIYYNDIGSYPLSSGDYRIKGLDGNAVSWGNSWMPYMSTLPKDPSASRNYIYCSTGQSYYLYASLEGTGVIATNNCSSLATICGSGVPICNYGVSSSNVSP